MVTFLETWSSEDFTGGNRAWYRALHDCIGIMNGQYNKVLHVSGVTLE